VCRSWTVSTGSPWGAWPGGFILGSSNSIHPGVAVENFLAMVDAGRKYGRYPV
jgi:hypothetical protein